jgi:uncharacterized membrane protein
VSELETAAEPARIRAADVRASHGAKWVASGFRIFRGQPMAWTGMPVGWLVMTFGLFLIPLLGPVLAYLLQPVFFASFALTAAKQLAGERIEMGDLFLGFRGNVKALLAVGAIEFATVFGVSLLMAMLGLPSAADPTGKMLAPEEIVSQLKGKEWILVFGFLVIALVKGALWFAPPLIAFHGLSMPHAVRWSVYAALSNLGAMLVYGAAVTVMMMVAMIPWGLGLLIALPVMVTSTYAGYRDVFEN